MMTLLRTSLCASALLASGAFAALAAPTPADFGASTFMQSPSCGVGYVSPVRVAAVLGVKPICCNGHARCSQFLATTRIVHGHKPTHT